jgi:hypothetical protein
MDYKNYTHPESNPIVVTVVNNANVDKEVSLFCKKPDNDIDILYEYLDNKVYDVYYISFTSFAFLGTEIKTDDFTWQESYFKGDVTKVISLSERDLEKISKEVYPIQKIKTSIKFNIAAKSKIMVYFYPSLFLNNNSL